MRQHVAPFENYLLRSTYVIGLIKIFSFIIFWFLFLVLPIAVGIEAVVVAIVVAD